MSYTGTRSTIVPELCFLLLGKGRVGCNFTWMLAPVGVMFWVYGKAQRNNAFPQPP